MTQKVEEVEISYRDPKTGKWVKATLRPEHRKKAEAYLKKLKREIAEQAAEERPKEKPE